MDSTPRKTASILNRLTSHFQWNQFCTFLWHDISLAVIMICTWCYASEKLVCDGWEPFLTRRITLGETGKWLERLRMSAYDVTDTAGVAHTLEIGPFAYAITVALTVLLVIQLVGWALNWIEERNTLRRFLKPIDDIALAADRIAANSFDPGKIESFEHAIERINEPNTRVEVDDADLEGLSAAVNNMLKRLQESARQQMRFVDDASHELRTPIAVIQGYVNMLDRWGKDDPKVLAESITAIQTESDHMKTLVEQLLFLARGDMGRTQMALKPLPLASLVSEIYDESRMIDPAHTYKLAIETEPAANADAAMLKQAVRILVDNAAKYTEPNGEILLRLRQSDTEAMIDAQDSGIGIASSDAPHVFERFYRADPARKKSGSGLGLSIAQWIITSHGGHIELVSFENIGTRMTVCLPLARCGASPSPADGNPV